MIAWLSRQSLYINFDDSMGVLGVWFLKK